MFTIWDKIAIELCILQSRQLWVRVFYPLNGVVGNLDQGQGQIQQVESSREKKTALHHQ